MTAFAAWLRSGPQRDGARHYCTMCGAEWLPGDAAAGERIAEARAFLRAHQHGGTW